VSALSVVETRIFDLLLFGYGLSCLLYLIYLIVPRRLTGRAATSVLVLCLVAHTAVIVLRYAEAQRPPFQTLYESLSWFAWTSVLAYLFAEWRRKIRVTGVIVTAVATAACIYANTLPHGVKPLYPALQSVWFFWHVSVAFASYAIFVVAFAVEVSYLVAARQVRRGRGLAYGLDRDSVIVFHRMAYNLILFGFPLLTFGIFSGAAWAETAWGRYWAWDPKETWSLITWTVYAIYLHAKVTPRWSGGRASALNILGFICMIFTFVGVNWLAKLLGLQSLHLYAV
jgi:cytochrome c-type biogenesis protein CcsB